MTQQSQMILVIYTSYVIKFLFCLIYLPAIILYQTIFFSF